MSKLSRRSLLGGLLAGSAMAGASGLLPRAASAASPIGITPPFGKFKILEIFLEGGADLWMHGYQTPWSEYATWMDNVNNTVGLSHINHHDWDDTFLTSAGNSPPPPPHPLWIPAQPTVNPYVSGDYHVFGFDSNGAEVRWGPAFKPLWRAGLEPHTRMVMVGHNLAPHEAAVPLAITGTGLGRAIGFGLGAAVNRDRPTGTAPVSFVIPVVSAGVSGATLAAVTTGFHGVENTPVVLPIGSNTTYARLNRAVPTAPGRVPRATGDHLRAHYRDQYASMLTRVDRVRSGGYDAYDGALHTMMDYQAVRSRISMLDLTPGGNIYTNAVATAIKAGFDLLKPTLGGGGDASHVTVVDAYWDAHGTSTMPPDASDYALTNTRKIFAVAHAIADAYATGSFDPSTTLVYIHSEFGRCHEQLNGGAHWPGAYPVILMGGPVNSAPGWSNPLVGATDDLSGSANVDGQNTPYPAGQSAYGVTDVRAAVAYAAGLDPWHPQMYGPSFDWLGDVLGGLYASTQGDLRNDSASYDFLQQDILGA